MAPRIDGRCSRLPGRSDSMPLKWETKNEFAMGRPSCRVNRGWKWLLNRKLLC